MIASTVRLRQVMEIIHLIFLIKVYLRGKVLPMYLPRAADKRQQCCLWTGSGLQETTAAFLLSAITAWLQR